MKLLQVGRGTVQRSARADLTGLEIHVQHKSARESGGNDFLEQDGKYFFERSAESRRKAVESRADLRRSPEAAGSSTFLRSGVAMVRSQPRPATSGAEPRACG